MSKFQVKLVETTYSCLPISFWPSQSFKTKTLRVWNQTPLLYSKYDCLILKFDLNYSTLASLKMLSRICLIFLELFNNFRTNSPWKFWIIILSKILFSFKLRGFIFLFKLGLSYTGLFDCNSLFLINSSLSYSLMMLSLISIFLLMPIESSECTLGLSDS